MNTKSALICYGIAAVMATWGWFNQAVLLFDFVIMSLIVVGVTIFGVE